MKRILTFAMLTCLSVDAFALTKTEAKVVYEADVKKVLSGDLTFDWEQFRLASVQGGTDYFDWHPVRAQFMAEMKSGDTSAALASARKISDHNMVEPEGHLLAMIADRALGKTDDAAFEHKVVDAWVRSLMSSGDGKSKETAFFVVDEGEEYMYLGLVLDVGLPESQSLVEKDGHSYDLLKVKDSDGKEQEVWFNVDTSMNAMRDAIAGAAKH
jgi:hypothetical protein